MSELYLIFFGVGLVLFGAIVGFSVYLQRKQANGSVTNKGLKKTVKHKVQTTPTKIKESSDPSSFKDLDRTLDNDSSGVESPLMPAESLSSSVGGDELVKGESLMAEEVLVVSSNEAVAQQNKQEPTLNEVPSQANEEPPEPTPSATIHQAELAPKPKLDKNSSSVVTDLVARIKNSNPIEQQDLLSIFRKHDFKFHRKIHIYGLNQLTDMWRDIEFELPSARFVELGISIQLADREGAMSPKELHDFQQMVLEFTNTFDAPFEFSMDIDDALKQALALDQIGRRYDSMAVLNVVPKSKSGFRMADIESCARDLMMSTDKNGIFMKTSGQKNNITVHFRLACTDDSGQFGISSGSSKPVYDLVVYMNVPATKDPEMVFQEMVKDANSLATWLEGKVVDRHGRHMTQRSYSTLMQQVSDIAFSMEQDGFTPGDAVAKKIF